MLETFDLQNIFFENFLFSNYDSNYSAYSQITKNDKIGVF